MYIHIYVYIYILFILFVVMLGLCMYTHVYIYICIYACEYVYENSLMYMMYKSRRCADADASSIPPAVGGGRVPPTPHPMFLCISVPPGGREAPAMQARRARSARSEPGDCS